MYEVRKISCLSAGKGPWENQQAAEPPAGRSCAGHFGKAEMQLSREAVDFIDSLLHLQDEKISSHSAHPEILNRLLADDETCTQRRRRPAK